MSVEGVPHHAAVLEQMGFAASCATTAGRFKDPADYPQIIDMFIERLQCSVALAAGVGNTFSPLQAAIIPAVATAW